MSDCSSHALDARPISGEIHWKDGQRPSELSYVRYVNGRERVAEHVELDGERFERVRECGVEERTSGWGGITRHCGNCGADLDCDTRNRQNYCPRCGARLKGSES